MSDLPEESRLNSLDTVRAAGYAAFGQMDYAVAVLDLQYDSIVDSPVGPINDARHLRFASQECSVDVNLRGGQRLTVDVSVTPQESVVVELCTRNACGQNRIEWSSGLTLTRIRPQLSSFYLHWPKSTRRPVRTAWVLL